MNYTEKPDLGEFFKPDFYGIDDAPFDLEQYCIFKCISGSRAYGTSTPASDVDLRGVFLTPTQLLLGLNTIEQIENQSKDICYYGLKKAFTLLLKNNVHLMELLYMDTKNVLVLRQPWIEVINNREIFTSKLIGYSFGGYAFGQLKMANVKKVNYSGRVALLDEFGYDCKLAMHCIRLLRSGREFLTSGVLTVARPDALELLEIRNGKYAYNEFVEWNQQKQIVGGFVKHEFDLFNEAFNNSKLPDKPNFDTVNNLLIKIQKEQLK